MPIVEGTAQENVDAKPLVATVDSKALGTAFAHALREAGIGGNQSNGGQARPKSLNDLFAELKANPDNDEATLSSIKDMFDTFRQEIDAAGDGKLRAELGKQRDIHTHNVIRMALDAHIGEDAALKEYLPEIKDRVIKRFNTEDKFQAERVRYGNGDVDVETLKAIALEEINKFNKMRGADKPSKSPTGIKAGGMSETAAIAADRGDDDDETRGVDPKQLDQQERDLYNAKLGIAQKMGHRRDSKEALAIASKAVRNLRNGKAQAKAKGLR